MVQQPFVPGMGDMGMHYGASGGHAYAPAPAAPHRPPYLASETDGRVYAPREPWAHSLKTLLLVFGVLLAACFVAPWGVAGGKTIFSWSILTGPGLVTKLLPLLLGGSAILAVVFSLTPLSVAGRGLAAGLLGLVCLHTLPVIALVDGLKSGFEPMLLTHSALAIIATATLIPGLLLRSQYRSALLPRILTTIGVLCAIAPFLIPVGGAIPLVGAFKSAIATPLQVGPIVTLTFVVITILALLVWLPASTGAGAVILAWLLLARLIAEPWINTFAHGFDIDSIKAQLSAIFYLPLAGLAWTTLCGYGIASFYGKKLEQ